MCFRSLRDRGNVIGFSGAIYTSISHDQYRAFSGITFCCLTLYTSLEQSGVRADMVHGVQSLIELQPSIERNSGAASLNNRG